MFGAVTSAPCTRCGAAPPHSSQGRGSTRQGLVEEAVAALDIGELLENPPDDVRGPRVEMFLNARRGEVTG